MLHLSFTPFPELFTARLKLRELRMEDDAAVFLLRSDKLVNRFIDRPKAQSIEDARNFIHRIQDNIQKNEAIYWAICAKETDQMIGSICLWNIDREKEKGEIGYELLPAQQGKGIMQEALLQVIKYGLEIMKLQKIEACTVSKNIRSIKILEKNKFQRDHNAEKNISAEEDPQTVIFFLNKSHPQ